MNSRKLFALFLVLALTGSALAVQQQRLYRQESTRDIDPTAEGVIAIQQHSVFVEIVVEIEQDVEQIHQFAAVVGLVKKCKKVRNVFDNAVLWFNDQFLFGNKTNRSVNVTPDSALGQNPDRTISFDDMLDRNRNNGTGEYNATTGGFEAHVENRTGVPQEGGNPDRDGFARDARDPVTNEFLERWGGCFIPDGFVHAIGSDDPYSLGTIEDDEYTIEQQNQDADVDGDGDNDVHADHRGDGSGHTEGPVGSADRDRSSNTSAYLEEDTDGDGTQDRFGVENLEEGTGSYAIPEICGNICLTKELIDLDNDCQGCLFEYVGTFYITDPNNHRWVIDKFVYPLDVANFVGLGDDPTNCHIGPGSTIITYIPQCGLEADRHNDRAEDDGVPENQFYDDGECEANRHNATQGDQRPDECYDNDGDGFYDDSEPTNTVWDQENEQSNENVDNHCYDDSSTPDECDADRSDPTDVKHVECEGGELTPENNPFRLGENHRCVLNEAKFTTKEPLYTVHIQVDPWNPDRQGFVDEAIWSYRDGTLRVGTPYNEGSYDANGNFTAPEGSLAEYCHDNAALGPDDGDPADPDDWAYEYDYLSAEGGPAGEGDHGAKDWRHDEMNGTLDWVPYRRGPVGNTAECALEYNFLIAVDFEAFDDTPHIQENTSLSGIGSVQADTQRAGEGENEILRDFKEHGNGSADEADEAWQGNSHPYDPTHAICDAGEEYRRGTVDDTNGQTGPSPGDDTNDTTGEVEDEHDWDEEGLAGTNPTVGCFPDDNRTHDNRHTHDALALDMFFYASAPHFVEENPYWDHANETDTLKTTGTPPIVDDKCTTAPNLPPDDYRRQAIEVRTPIVCDVDAMDGYHLHDGSQTIP